jgi:hypothetical protein
VASAGYQQGQQGSSTRGSLFNGLGGGGGSVGSVSQISESLTQYQVRANNENIKLSCKRHRLIVCFLFSFPCLDHELRPQRNVGILEKIAQQLLVTSSNRANRTELEQQ